MGTPPPPPPSPHRGQCRDLTFIKSNAPKLEINNRSNCPSTHACFKYRVILFRQAMQSSVSQFPSLCGNSSFDTTCLRAWYLPCAGALLRCWIRVVPISLPASASLFPAISLSLSPDKHTQNLLYFTLFPPHALYNIILPLTLRQKPS